MHLSNLPFSEIPHQSKLFLDHLRDPLSLKRYYPNAVSSHTDISFFIPEVLSNYKTDRGNLCDALTEVNSEINASEKTLENIKQLREPDTVAVVTGQQAGLFTGPLYTIYKALSAIKMAEELNAKGVKAVPVFWVATEDHDFDEVSHTFFTGQAGELVKAECHPQYLKSSPVGNIKIDDSIVAAIDRAFGAIPRSEFSSSVRSSIEKNWSVGALFGKAFSRSVAEILGSFGIVVIDPMHPGVKALSAPIYVDAITSSAEIVANIRHNSSELVSEGYHAQVLVEEDYFPLFRIDDEGRRVALRKTANGKYLSKEEKREFDLDELSAMAKSDPHRLSPGVMLRPVVQDYLLPTVCYFGGAAEIAYFAQNSAAYKVLHRPVTPILHRQSFTVVESKHRRALQKFDLALSNMFAGFKSTLESLGKKQLSSETIRLFDEIEQKINSEMERLDQNLSQIDKTLSDNLAKRRRKILYHIGTLKKKTYLAATRNDETLERQIRSAFESLLPNNELQERVINIHSFLNKYGPHFVGLIYKEVDLNNKDHRIVDL